MEERNRLSAAVFMMLLEQSTSARMPIKCSYITMYIVQSILALFPGLFKFSNGAGNKAECSSTFHYSHPKYFFLHNYVTDQRSVPT